MIKNLEHINREKVGFCLDRVKFNKKITLNNETILKNHINENSIKNNSIIENKQKIFNIKTFPTLILLLSIFFLISTIAFAIPNSLTIQGKLTKSADITKVVLL